jgi:phosphate transport system permease protein
MFFSKSDKLLFYSTLPLIVGVLGILLILSYMILSQSWPSFQRFGFAVLTTSAWSPSDDPQREFYGLAAPIASSLYVSILSVLVSVPISICLTLTLIEILPKYLGASLRYVTEVMGGLPTVIYGLWGSTTLAPFLRDQVMKPLHDYLGFIPLFSCRPLTGHSMLAASITLAVATTPYVTALLIEGYYLIPSKYKEGAYSLGATDYEAYKIMMGILKPYVIAASLLGFSRALSETTIVALTVGNSMKLSLCLFDPAYTIPSLIANQFESARLYEYALPTLFAGALILLLISLAASYAGIRLVYGWRERIHV